MSDAHSEGRSGPKQAASAPTGGGSERLQVKAKLLRELRDYARGGMAQELKTKYRPAPPPAAEPEPVSTDPVEDDADLTKLDEDTISRLLGD